MTSPVQATISVDINKTLEVIKGCIKDFRDAAKSKKEREQASFKVFTAGLAVHPVAQYLVNEPTRPADGPNEPRRATHFCRNIETDGLRSIICFKGTYTLPTK